MRVPRLLSVLLLASSGLLSNHIRAQSTDSAKAFVESIYQHYRNGGDGLSFTGSEAKQYFHPSLLALVKADQHAVGDGFEPVYADADSLCDCQDWDEIWDLKIVVRLRDSTHAVANASFWLSKAQTEQDFRIVTLILASEHGQWLVYDIVDHTNRETPFRLRQAIGNELRTLAQHPDSTDSIKKK